MSILVVAQLLHMSVSLEQVSEMELLGYSTQIKVSGNTGKLSSRKCILYPQPLRSSCQLSWSVLTDS